jgi:hypothetical protein
MLATVMLSNPIETSTVNFASYSSMPTVPIVVGEDFFGGSQSSVDFEGHCSDWFEIMPRPSLEFAGSLFYYSSEDSTKPLADSAARPRTCLSGRAGTTDNLAGAGTSGLMPRPALSSTFSLLHTCRFAKGRAS